jgi:hypothetical protein
MAVETIATEAQGCCPLCESPGRPKYQALNDRLFCAPGVWNIKECDRRGCESLWLDPRPTTGGRGQGPVGVAIAQAVALLLVVTPIAALALRRHQEGPS